jgi:hypothetical protein
MTGDGTPPTALVPRMAAGKLDRGADAGRIHLIERQRDGRWRARCPAGDHGGPHRAQARPTLSPIDCDGCLAGDGDLVRVVNVIIGEQLAELTRAAALVEAFLDWAAIDTGLDQGGAVLAIYAGGTRLHPVVSDERRGLVGRWVQTRREYP